MNHIYKVIWSRVKNSYVVVSEIAGTARKSGRVRVSKNTLAAVLAAFLLTGISVSPVSAALDGVNTFVEPGNQNIKIGNGTDLRNNSTKNGAIAIGDHAQIDDYVMQEGSIAIGKNVKIGRENAIMNGITSYASRAKAQVVGKMKGLMSSEASSTPEEEIDKFGAAYESGVNTKIAGLVKQHLVLVKENKDGSKEFNVYMSIDEAKAKKAREEAALAAKKQAALGVLSQQVEEFIGEPVEAE
jgi:hypothetical protein